MAPHSVSHFLKQAWPKDPFVVHGLSASIEEILRLPFLQSLDSLLNSWPHLVQAHLPDVADESSAVDATPQDARKLFANKMGLLFNNVEKISSLLTEVLGNIRIDLGLPASTYGRCIIYATPDGKGTAAHFDQNINFVLQIHGTKKWKLAPNSSFENPTQRHTIGQPLDPELETYVHDEIPTEMPSEGASEFILKPGSMLFVPRGFWHSTEASGEALALNFTFNQPTWADLLLLALRSRLTLSPEWRELADGVSSEEMVRRFAAHEEFNRLLSDLVEDLPNWKAADILGATEGSTIE